ncbi:hypothetical protein BC828DRAFT_373286 [Blastocladiella britannica]|nr:hypothetical protein BC828DRAFT_373286 [Blastocladiella britannica]
MNPAEVTFPRSVFVSLKKAGFKSVKDTLIEFNSAMLGIDDCDIDNAVVLTANTIRRLFDKVLTDILAVTAEMMRDCATDGATKRINKVVCVGGFCNNKYLVRSVRAMIDAKFPGVQVVVPANPGSAVLYGAALYGTSPSVVGSRVMRYTYGFESNLLLDNPRFEGMDQRDWTIFSDAEGERRIRNGFSIIVKKGQSLEANESANKVVNPSSPTQTEVDIPIYLSDSDNPVRVAEQGCRFLGKITLTVEPGQPERERIEVKFLFGASEISVVARSLNTGTTTTATISYE